MRVTQVLIAVLAGVALLSAAPALGAAKKTVTVGDNYLLPQKLRMTTSPRCSDNRTLPPAMAWSAKSGASCAFNGYEVSAIAGAQNVTAARHSRNPNLNLVGGHHHE